MCQLPLESSTCYRPPDVEPYREELRPEASELEEKERVCARVARWRLFVLLILDEYDVTCTGVIRIVDRHLVTLVCAAAQLAATNLSSLFTSFPAEILACVCARVRDVINEPPVNCACS